jgi:hypothetical protein
LNVEVGSKVGGVKSERGQKWEGSKVGGVKIGLGQKWEGTKKVKVVCGKLIAKILSLTTTLPD